MTCFVVVAGAYGGGAGGGQQHGYGAGGADASCGAGAGQQRGTGAGAGYGNFWTGAGVGGLLGRCCGRQDQSYFFPDLLNLKKDLGKPISEVLNNFETSRIHNFVILGRYNRYGRYAGQSWARDSENATHRQPFFCLTTVVTLSRQCYRVPISLL